MSQDLKVPWVVFKVTLKSIKDALDARLTTLRISVPMAESMVTVVAFFSEIDTHTMDFKVLNLHKRYSHKYLLNLQPSPNM